jgi:peptidoglycan/xylan/chitin deacetylase (PgdA/CDA1 family)
LGAFVRGPVSAMADRLAILAWHNVEATWWYPSRPGQGVRGLVRQLRSLQRFANVVPLEPALDALAAGRPLPPRAVALSWDDGYRDSLELVAPLLERFQMPATFFLVPGLLSGEVRAWWELLAWAWARSPRNSVRWDGRDLPVAGPAGRRSLQWLGLQLQAHSRAARDQRIAELLERLGAAGEPDDRGLFLDWSGAKQLAGRGFAIGSHSMYHAILGNEPVEEQQQDLSTSRARLEQELGVPIRLFAYPSGQANDYGPETVHAAARAGYTHAFTTRAGWNRPSTSVLEGHRVLIEPQRAFPNLAARRLAARAARQLRRVTVRVSDGR